MDDADVCSSAVASLTTVWSGLHRWAVPGSIKPVLGVLDGLGLLRALRSQSCTAPLQI